MARASLLSMPAQGWVEGCAVTGLGSLAQPTVAALAVAREPGDSDRLKLARLARCAALVGDAKQL